MINKTSKYLRLSLFSCLLWLGVFSPKQGSGAHIAGAELVYDCIGNGAYDVTLTLFRDCFGGGANFDNTVTLFIFDAVADTLVTSANFSRPPQTPFLNPPNWSACVGSTPPFCVEVGVYNDIIILPPNLNGYNLAWARCCRNNAISNLLRPGCEGVTFLARIPGVNDAVCNSMPKFDQFPPLFLCAGEPFFFDHSATDVDGDSLVYEISRPYTGVNFNGIGAANPNGPPCNNIGSPVVNLGNPMGPAPYDTVIFAPGFSSVNPFGSGSISIDRFTGFLSAQPMNPGIYVLAISVKEYRNGVLLSENKRDFQFHVVNCLPQGTPPRITHDLAGLSSSNDTIFITGARPFCYDFTVTDSLIPSTILVEPVSLAFGGNGGFPPPYATLTLSGNSPPVDGSICWETSCAQVGQTIDFIITARDTNDCPNYNIVFDTIYVTILPPPNAPPAVQHNLTAVPVSSNDTIYADVRENFCFEFYVIDTIGDGNLASSVTILDSLNNILPSQPNFSSVMRGDTLVGSVCFDTECYFGDGYKFVISGLDEYQCPPLNQSQDTVHLVVAEPANPTPTVATDLLANPVSGDTIEANVHQNFCFEFEVADTSARGADSLYFSYRIEDLNGNFSGEPATYFAFSAGDTISGEICWTPRCLNVDQLFRIIVTGHQVNYCGITNRVRDTVYVRVSEPIKPIPLLTHDTGPNFPGNAVINIADNDTFCFTFSMIDTVTPTFVSVETEVSFANGSPYSGPLPGVNFTSRSDSTLFGTICWEIPCDYADESFKIRLIGRDTFDCHSGNIVYDSVIVNHTENPPTAMTLCRVTVEPGDQSNLLEWEASNVGDLASYAILRRRADEPVFTAIDTLFNTQLTSYLDQGIQADEYVYCYSIVPVDRCGNTPLNNEVACTILLEGSPAEYSSELNWTSYIGFQGGVNTYEIFRNFPHLNIMNQPVWSNPANQLTYFDGDINEGQVCYRVQATANGTGCGEESWSNEVCVEFPPLLFVPNAFSPNGDQVNDNFLPVGAFMQSFVLQIWDRWGKLVYETRDLQTGWDGTLGGRTAPEGVYIFKVEVTGFDGSVLRRNGSVTLVR